MIKRPILLIDEKEKEVASMHFLRDNLINFEMYEEREDGWPVYYSYCESKDIFLDEQDNEVKAEVIWK